MVQKGKFSAAAWLFVNTLKKVDFPTLGIPTMPTFKLVPTRPISGFRSGSSIFFGAILRKIEIYRHPFRPPQPTPPIRPIQRNVDSSSRIRRINAWLSTNGRKKERKKGEKRYINICIYTARVNVEMKMTRHSLARAPRPSSSIPTLGIFNTCPRPWRCLERNQGREGE